jgi:uncharacterized protein (TIGR03084 family)
MTAPTEVSMSDPQATGPALDELLADLGAERSTLQRVLDPLPADRWTAATPAEPWTVRDQVAHLGFFDAVATTAATSPQDFQRELVTAVADYDGYMAASLTAAPADGPEALAWWRERAEHFDQAYAAADPKSKVPWYGPPMSTRSMVTARLMEVWAHGQDVRDALGLKPEATDRLRHICHLAIRTRAYSYRIRSLEPPDEPVGLKLTLPSGEAWLHEPGAAQQITGDAVDLCLVLTRRRHPDDTALIADGPLAEQWLQIGQAFAGPGGTGRRPGQFADGTT